MRPDSRGALSNPEGRFERFIRESEEEAPPAPVATTVTADATRSILARNDSPDIPFDRSVNPYRGCEHGCVYCFARPTHAFLGLSPGLDFETKILAKPAAAALLRAELSRPGYRCDVLALGSNTDPYQPVERRLRITRQVVEVLAEFRHPVSIVTKSALVLRDLDLLAPMAGDRLASVMISITTLDDGLARRMEPRAALPRRRLETVRSLAGAGVPVGVLVSPVIPALNEHEIERILEAAAEAGASTAGWLLLRLPYEVKDLFTEWLREREPLRADHVLSRIRQARGGELNDPRFGSRMRGSGPAIEAIGSRFAIARRRYGLAGEKPSLDTTRFRVPPRSGDQRSLFEPG